ncbi:MAG: ABC transporter ATP-binding protein [Lentisphaeria bacterium]|nr:ABC transporter ATP-binding protein [Lentisphaeria bacterium]
MALIELRDITKNYPLGDDFISVLNGVSLEIEPGEYVALMGASGSGKSTLMNILGCLDRPSGGDYFFDGVELGRADGDLRAGIRNRKIGFVFQSFNLLPRTSALENVIMPLAYTAGSLSRSERRKRGMAALEAVGIADRSEHHPSQLSGGQQQRVAIARALINRPPVIFADEPTGNLDSHTSVEVMNLFQQLNADGITVILVTHSQAIARYARRTICMSDGRIVSGLFEGGLAQ